MMVMKKLFLPFLLLLLIACSKDRHISHPAHFQTEVLLKHTPVKDQGKSDLSWIYAMLATIETERLMLGDSVHLSPEYVGRMFLIEQAEQRFLTRGKQHISTRGMGMTVLGLLERYGVLSYDSYRVSRGANFKSIARRLSLMTDASWSHGGELKKLHADIEDMLDNDISPAPRFVFMYSCEYTPVQFAQSVCKRSDYKSFTSFSHQSFGQPFVLDTPENFYKDSLTNVPLDSLMALMEGSIRAGHAVYWEGDTTNDGYSFEEGIACLEKESEMVTQEMRQKAFDASHISNDHSLAMIGLAIDENGNRYFICKDSHGIKNPYRGLVYMSFNYARLNTVSITLLIEN